MEARMAGEFVTQTTPSYVGGEIVRIAWLIKNGVPTGDATWVATTGDHCRRVCWYILAFIAGALALFHGGTFIGIVVILVTIPTFSFWFLVVSFRLTGTFNCHILQQDYFKDFFQERDPCV